MVDAPAFAQADVTGATSACSKGIAYGVIPERRKHSAPSPSKLALSFPWFHGLPLTIAEKLAGQWPPLNPQATLSPHAPVAQLDRTQHSSCWSRGLEPHRERVVHQDLEIEVARRPERTALERAVVNAVHGNRH